MGCNHRSGRFRSRRRAAAACSSRSAGSSANVRSVNRALDPEGAHLAALNRLADFTGQQVLELGCGDGRLTVGVAPHAARVLAFDPNADAVASARRCLPAELAARVSYEVASGREIDVEPGSFDLALFSWSL
jgi:methylase of polypeptide subunit release factors